MSRHLALEIQPLQDDVGEDFARMRGFEAAIEVDGRLDALVTQNAPYKLVFAGAVL